MADIVHLHKVEDFKDQFPLNVDVDAKILKNVLQIAQEIKIQGFLGTALYKKVLALVLSGEISDLGNEVYKELLDDHIIKTLGYFGYVEALLHISREFTDKGAQTKKGEWSDPVDTAELKFLRQEALNKAEFMSTLMVDFLCTNQNDLPEYIDPDKEGITPNKEAYFSGMELDHLAHHRHRRDEDDCC